MAVIRVSVQAEAAAWRRALEDCGFTPEEIRQISLIEARRVLLRMLARL